MNNKERAIAFLRLASSGKVREAYETYVHPDFRHHNLYFPGRSSSAVSRDGGKCSHISPEAI